MSKMWSILLRDTVKFAPWYQMRSGQRLRLSILPRDANILAIAGLKTHNIDGQVIMSPALFC